MGPSFNVSPPPPWAPAIVLPLRGDRNLRSRTGWIASLECAAARRNVGVGEFCGMHNAHPGAARERGDGCVGQRKLRKVAVYIRECPVGAGRVRISPPPPMPCKRRQTSPKSFGISNPVLAG